MKTKAPIRFGLALVSCLAVQAATADMILNLSGQDYNIPHPNGPLVTSQDVGTITTSLGTVTFSFFTDQPAGSGAIDSFLRLQGPSDGDAEQAYNTSTSNQTLPFDAVPGPFTRDVLLSDLTLNPDTGNYEFLLDINESSGGNKSLISLDGLKLYATNTVADSNVAENGRNIVSQGNGNNEVLVGDWAGPEDGGLLLWDMDDEYQANNWILLDFDRNKGGSGVFDMKMDVPEAIINAGKNAGYTNFVLWSRFGLNEGATPGSIADSGYEEWTQVIYSGGDTPGPGPGVPVPAPLALLGLGAFLLGRRIRS